MSMGKAALQRLAGKTIFITGASSGIGKATALEYANAADGQVSLILAARRLDKLQEVKNQLQTQFPSLKCHVGELDVSKSGSIGPFLESLPEDFKDIDILVNNAGKALGNDKVGTIKQQDVTETFDTNVLGMIAITQAVLPIFKKKNSGDILFNLVQLLEGMHTQLLKFNLVQLKTEFSIVRNYGDKNKADEVYKGRKPLYADDIAELIVFATSRKSNTVVAELLVFPTDQASASHVYKRPE
ncbi:Sulfoacetaldehyde reductase [Cyberlindnera fabianii]|uniref:Sulfoacetaldehyde reductase n=1 Tax=Cyberlindnera fabianii TaxID=36022 RepID=A0A1V2LBB0_CYBFA|nr:Sulfoacetaldehyde reductase [Cyberlindnera fabianii]